MVTIEEWKQICKEEGAWCSYEEVKDMTYEQAVQYVHTMPTFEPM